MNATEQLGEVRQQLMFLRLVLRGYVKDGNGINSEDTKELYDATDRMCETVGLERRGC